MKKIRLLILPIITIVLEILPYGAVLVFMLLFKSLQLIRSLSTLMTMISLNVTMKSRLLKLKQKNQRKHQRKKRKLLLRNQLLKKQQKKLLQRRKLSNNY